MLVDGRSVVLTGHVIREGYPPEIYRGAARQSIDIETEEVVGEGGIQPFRAGVRLTIRGSPEEQSRPEEERGEIEFQPNAGLPVSLNYGSRLRLRARLHPPRNYRNPGAFDYEGYLHDRGVRLLGTADARDIEPLPGFVGSRVELYRTRIHGSIVGQNPPTVAVAAGGADGRHGPRGKKPFCAMQRARNISARELITFSWFRA